MGAALSIRNTPQTAVKISGRLTTEQAVQPAPRSRRPVTVRQRFVLAFIVSHLEKQGIPPTLREIGSHMGIRSTNGVNDHLEALVAKGCIVRNAMQSRAIQVLRKGYETLKLPVPETKAPSFEPALRVGSRASELLRRALPILAEVVPTSELVDLIRKELES